LGNPVRLILTQGQTSEHQKSHALIAGFGAEFILADKGYDSNIFVQSIRNSGAEPVIPPRSNRIKLRDYDRHLYKSRNLVECFFQKIKNYRRIATRYERLARNYDAMLSLVAIMVWLA